MKTLLGGVTSGKATFYPPVVQAKRPAKGSRAATGAKTPQGYIGK